MKVTLATAASAVVVGVSAQSASTVTVFADLCSTFTGAQLTGTPGVPGAPGAPAPTALAGPQNGTAATTVFQNCPVCAALGMTPYPGNSLTTYTTTMDAICPTGLSMAAYTVTEPCPSTGLARSAGYVPQGFTVTTVPCPVCPSSPSVVITTPVPAPVLPTAGKGIPAAANAVPTAPPAGSSPNAPADAPLNAPPNSPANAPANAPANSPANAAANSPANAPANAPGGGGSTPGSNAAAAPGGSSPAGAPNGSPPPYPVSPATQGRTGPGATGTAASNNTVTPFTGAGTHLALGTSFIACLIGLITAFASSI